MKQISDELLNKYIDNELTAEELGELEYLIKENPSALEKLKAQKLVDSYLHELPIDKTSVAFTNLVMEKLSKVSSVSGQKSYFFFSVIAVFTFMILLMVAFFLTQFSISNGELMNTQAMIDKFNAYLATGTAQYFSIFKNGSVTILIAASSMVIMFGAYFLYESHKSFKRKLRSFVH